MYSLRKHARERHEDIDENSPTADFYDQEGNVTVLPVPLEKLDRKSKEGYRMWLDGIIERITSAFHPRLPGKFMKGGR